MNRVGSNGLKEADTKSFLSDYKLTVQEDTLSGELIGYLVHGLCHICDDNGHWGRWTIKTESKKVSTIP